MIYEIEDTSLIVPLFKEWEESLICSYFQGHMGKAIANHCCHPTAALIIIDVFFFFAGKVDDELIEYSVKSKDFLILTPQNEAWGSRIEKLCINAHKRVRYALKNEQDVFDKKILEGYVKRLSPMYSLHFLDNLYYDEVMKETWSRDLCSVFKDKEEYILHGLGVVALKDGNIVSGASSYVYYDKGIEIEIDTLKEERRQGLALACGAMLILECLKRGWYPSWDAQNTGSLALARKLGYHFDYAYTVYEVSK